MHTRQILFESITTLLKHRRMRAREKDRIMSFDGMKRYTLLVWCCPRTTFICIHLFEFECKNDEFYIYLNRLDLCEASNTRLHHRHRHHHRSVDMNMNIKPFTAQKERIWKSRSAIWFFRKNYGKEIRIFLFKCVNYSCVVSLTRVNIKQGCGIKILKSSHTWKGGHKAFYCHFFPYISRRIFVYIYKIQKKQKNVN